MVETLLDSKQVAQILGTTSRHVLDLSRRGILPSLRVGRFIRFRQEDVEKFIKLQRDKRSFTVT